MCRHAQLALYSIKLTTAARLHLASTDVTSPVGRAGHWLDSPSLSVLAAEGPSSISQRRATISALQKQTLQSAGAPAQDAVPTVGSIPSSPCGSNPAWNLQARVKPPGPAMSIGEISWGVRGSPSQGQQLTAQGRSLALLLPAHWSSR